MTEPAGPTPAKQKGRFYRPELDVLRCFAFLLVFMDHGIPAKHRAFAELGRMGALGVCLFFVLSSFLITELLRIEKERTGTIAMRAFYLRRILRIWPLQHVFVLSVFVIGLFFAAVYVKPVLLAEIFLFQMNWLPIKVGVPAILQPLWSISVEEQFYLLWPVLTLVFSARVLRVVSLLLLPMGAFAIAFVMHRGADVYGNLWSNSFIQFQMFGLGALLALALRGRIPQLSVAVRYLLFALGVGGYVVAQFGLGIRGGHVNTIPGVMVAFLLAGLGSCSLVFSVLGASVPRWLGPVRYMGKISYGMYVFHVVCLELTTYLFPSAQSLAFAAFKFFFALGCTVLAASASYRLIEAPFVRLKERFAVVKSRAA